jgi:uncharacterized protein
MRLKGLSEEEVARIVPPGTVLLAYRGSIAHGMYVPNSDPNSVDDKDLLGVAIADERVYLGFSDWEQREVQHGEWDSVVYEYRKFVRLLVQSNPNVLGLLWTNPRFFLICEPAGQVLVENRRLFVSRKAYHSFTGYAYGQLKKMTAMAFNGYMGDKRKQLVEKFGYDTKNAAHLIRLLRMGIEFLNEGELYVNRGEKGDAPQLLQIKRGEWTLEQVKAEADHLFKRAEAAYDACKLPAGPDLPAIEKILIGILRDSLLVKETK